MSCYFTMVAVDESGKPTAVPPLEPKTMFIWGAPFVMLLVGGFIIYRVARQRSRMPLDDESVTGP